MFDVNVFGVWNGVSVFGERFAAQAMPAGIYNIGSENSLFSAVPQGAGYVASKHAVLAMTEALRKELPDHMAMMQILAGEFWVVSHAYNIVRFRARHEQIEAAYAKYAPRYQGDDEFDVKTLGAKFGWWT